MERMTDERLAEIARHWDDGCMVGPEVANLLTEVRRARAENARLRAAPRVTPDDWRRLAETQGDAIKTLQADKARLREALDSVQRSDQYQHDYSCTPMAGREVADGEPLACTCHVAKVRAALRTP